MGVCMSMDDGNTQGMTDSGGSDNTVQKKKKKLMKKMMVMEMLHAEAKVHQILRTMPGRTGKNGSTANACLFSKQGRKGINQDCMLVWEGFGSQRNTVLCGIFDGHGPNGHLVARKLRDNLPILLALPLSLLSGSDVDGHVSDIEYAAPKDNDSEASFDNDDDDDNDDNNGDDHYTIHSHTAHPRRRRHIKQDIDMDGSYESTSHIKQDIDMDGSHESTNQLGTAALWKDKFVAAYKLMDKNLKSHPKLDCFGSGTTAVTLILQGNDLVVGNVGDSRCILATRSSNGALVAHQLTRDLKPNLPGELERIRRCKGRVFALKDEPHVARVWMPHVDMPGLAMARALGDFCLKDYGVSAVPELSYRKLEKQDEFIVLATDGIWDVLSNDDVVDIVASTFPKEEAAKALVQAANRAWKRRHRAWRMDDCSVVCYFLKERLKSFEGYKPTCKL